MVTVPILDLTPDPEQPRKDFSSAKATKSLNSLAASMREKGQLEPILIRPSVTTPPWYIVAGERRFHAAKINGWKSVEAIIRQETDRADIDEIQIVENLQREGLSPMEEARAYKRQLDRGITEAELAKRLGISQPWRIGEAVRRLNLAPEYVHLFESGNLSPEAVFEISRLENHADQHRVVKAINKGQLKGYVAINAAVRSILDGESQVDAFPAAPKATAAELRAVASVESRIDSAFRAISLGFKDGELVIAQRVAPDRLSTVADQLEQLQRHARLLEAEVRRALARIAVQETLAL